MVRFCILRDNNIWAHFVNAKTEKPVTGFQGRYGQFGGFTLDTDGMHVYFVWREDEGDVWIGDVIYDENAGS